MRAGTLRHKVEIQEATEVRNPMGGVAKVGWVTRATARMDILPQARNQGQERLTGDQIVADFDARFRGRYRDWLTPKMRLVFKGQTYDIKEIINVDTRNSEIEILAKRAA